MKRFAVLGRGTAGALAAIQASSELKNSEIVWVFDPETPTQAVGEGTTLDVVKTLSMDFNFRHTDLNKIDGHFKTGILKNGWGKTGEEFVHQFIPPSVAYHINAIKLQNFIFDKLKERKNVRIVEKNITSDQIDADYVIDCSGQPKTYNEYDLVTDIPVNSVYVTQCFWDYPKFNYSLTNAAKHGWYFGIPLQNRCSIGYLYNNTISTLEEVKEDVQHVFAKYQLTPSDTTNAFSFKNYYRKKILTEKVTYNGNCGFFLEPLEATTILNIIAVNKAAIQIFIKNESAHKIYSTKTNGDAINYLESIIDMISLHYMAGSVYETKFWKYAQKMGEKRFSSSLQTNERLNNLIKYILDPNYNYHDHSKLGYGSWAPFSWYDNIKGLGVEEKIRSFL